MTDSDQKFTATLPHSLWRAEQVRSAEPLLAQLAGVSLYELMQRAGEAAYQLLRERWPQARRLLVVAGRGNNGGDALVVARLAAADGLAVQLLVHGRSSGWACPADKAWEALSPSAIRLIDSISESEPADVVVDGLLGSGLSGEVRPAAHSLIEAINALRLPVLALDLPSGLASDSGQPLGAAVYAQATITFIGVKRGLLTAQAGAYCGDLLLADLQLGALLEQQLTADCTRSDYADYDHLLSPRSPVAHKGWFGRVLLLGGEQGTAGAIRLAGEACLRTGAGLVDVATRPAHLTAVLSGCPELMVHPLSSADEAKNELPALIERASVLVAGPGLGQSQWSQTLFAQALRAPQPLVLDADGLNLVARLAGARQNWIMTPHPGEAARLLACSVAEIEADRFAAAREIASRYQAVCVLKGAGTVIASPQGELRLSAVGNPGMASGGMGDVLSGIIGGLLAQGLALMDAACLGVIIHGKAADRAAAAGQRGMLAHDLMPAIRALVNPS